MKKQTKKDQRLRQELGRLLASGFYDHQQIRMSEMNRVRDVIRKKNEGIAFDEVEEKKEKKEKFKNEYADNRLRKTLAKMEKEGKLSESDAEYITKMMDLFDKAKDEELQYKRLLSEYISSEPVWEEFLFYIKGIGEILTANLIKNFGYCEKYAHVSSLWRHCGLSVTPEGTAPRMKKGEKLDYSPRLRTLAWKISDSFIKQRTDTYRGIYDSEKRRQLALMKNEAENAPKSKLHAELRSRRKMVKIFLQHYWIKTRTLKGLEVSMPYPQAKMGHKHYIDVEDVIKRARAKATKI